MEGGGGVGGDELWGPERERRTSKGEPWEGLGGRREEGGAQWYHEAATIRVQPERDSEFVTLPPPPAARRCPCRSWSNFGFKRCRAKCWLQRLRLRRCRGSVHVRAPMIISGLG